MRRCVTLTWAGTDPIVVMHSPGDASPGAFYISNHHNPPVGAAEGCDLLILKKQHQKIAAFGSSYSEFVFKIKSILKLWKTNSHTCQSATYRRCKWLFFHSFDLSPFTVELAVNNVGVAG